jgi:hypothetical protein
MIWLVLCVLILIKHIAALCSLWFATVNADLTVSNWVKRMFAPLNWQSQITIYKVLIPILMHPYFFYDFEGKVTLVRCVTYIVKHPVCVYNTRGGLFLYF